MADPVFFVPSRVWSAAEVAGLTGAILHDPAHGEVVVSRLASLAEGGDGTLVFIDGKRHLPDLKRLRAAAVFCSEDVAPSVPPGIAILLTPSPQKAFVAVARAMFPASLLPDPVMPVSGVSPAAHVDPTARLEPGTVVDAGAVVGPGVSIGTGTVVAANAVIGRNCQVGRGCRIGPNVTIQHALIGDGVIIHPGACIGQDGFGYLPGGQGAVKIPQLGRVVVQNDVEIGANTTIDRGALADTIIGEGTKIDNLVQIGHNVRIGRHCLIAGHVGIAGSTTLGDGVQVGGRVGISDHLNIGAGARLAAASAFMRDVPPGEVWGGVPAQRMTDALREINAIRKFAKAGAKKE